MKFSYKAQTSTGEVRLGEKEAADKFDLVKQLKQEGLTVLVANEISTRPSWFARLNAKVSTVPMKEKIFFASNLSEMINAGLSLSRALSVLERQTKNKKLKTIISDIASGIDQGSALAAGLSKYSDIFSPVFIAMVEAGEKSGRLPEALKVISDQLGKSYALRKKIRGAMVYPSVIVFAMGLIATLMLIYVVPQLAKTFNELGVALPVTTRFVLGASGLLANHALLIFGTLVVLFIGFLRALKTDIGKKIFSTVLLHLPIIGNLVKEFNAALTARTLGSLISAGVDLVEAINITERVIQNPYYKNIMRSAASVIPTGVTLSALFEKEQVLYPPFVSEMVMVGEETGKLAEMFGKLAQFYEDEVDAATKDMSQIVEPAIMIVVGAAVGFFALAMIQPIYSIGTSIK